MQRDPSEAPRPAAARPGASRPVVGWRIGPSDSATTLVVYGTYECLHCRRAWPALRALADAGRAQVEWRHFAPPGAFPNALAAASAAEAAGAQGAFWAMHEVLMTAPAPLWPEAMAAHAAALGLHAARFADDVRGAAVRARLEAQAAAAHDDAVRGTPTVWRERGGARERLPVEQLDV
jgi:protein-disulfide isomerase